MSSVLLLVPEMAESLVAFGHPVGLFLPLHGAAGVVGSVEQLEGELLGHTLPPALARETHEPAPGEGEPALGPDLDRDLVGGAAHPPGLDLQQRRGVAYGGVEDLHGLALGLAAGAAEGVVHVLLGFRAFAVAHDYVYVLGHNLSGVD